MNEFKFPDEMENENPQVEVDATTNSADSDEVEIEVVDSTPEKDRGRKPLERAVEDPTEEELKQYSDGVKKRIAELTHARHDERRKAEALAREREEFERAARALMEENKRLRQQYTQGAEVFAKTAASAAELELNAAKRKYKEAYDSGDADEIIAAQEALTDATLKLKDAKNFRPTPLQNEEEAVQMQPSIPARQNVDDDTLRWQARNQWFNHPDHDDMTAFALGVHKKLVKSGIDPRSREYYEQIDARMKSTFPDFFGVEDKPKSGEVSRKPGAVVAPATRSTSAKKVQLTPEQVNVARRLGITPQQYAVEMAKLEKQNG
jgi:hypothetical protein